MNNKGQALVVFILVLPLLIILAAFIVDNAYMTYKNIELKNVTKDIMKIHLTKGELSDEEIVNIYKKNNIPTEELIVMKTSSNINIKNTYYTDSIFGKIIGFKSYEVSTNVTGVLENNKVIFK